MPSRPRLPKTLTLEEFLELPEEAPYLEYHNGKAERKVSPQGKHSLLTVRITDRLNQFAEPRGLGIALVELRCTFGGRSIIPDVAFFREEHIAYDENGEIANAFECVPDIHIEIISPNQSVLKAQRNLRHSLAHGCPLGLLVHPKRKTIDVYRPGVPRERLGLDGIVHGDPVLPGFELSVTEVFGWLRRRRPNGTPGPDPEAPPA